MHSHVRIGRLFGIDIGLHVSWFIIAYLITVSVVQQFHAENPRWSTGLVFGTAIVTALLFFVTLLCHEMSHSLIARSQGIPVRAITLFALGGVSQLGGETPNAKTEFWMALGGPLMSLIIGVICFAIGRSLGWRWGAATHTPVAAVAVWLAYINIGLALFNLLPGFPLDGGRVLRAALWGITGDIHRATRWAAQTGHWIAILFILYGIFRFFAGAGFNGLWIAFIGWFLNDAAHATLAREQASQASEPGSNSECS